MKTLIYKYYIPILLACQLLTPSVTAQKVNISSGTKLVLNNNVALVVMNGGIINNGTVVPGSASSVYFRGTLSAGSITGSATNLSNLYVENCVATPLTISTPVSVTGMLGLVNGTSQINTNDQLTLKSTSAKTAMINSIPSGGTINGKVTVERFIQAHRAWRLLTVPISSSSAPTIHTSWQEAATGASDNPSAGFGTHITGGTAPSNGFDLNGVNNPSCRQYVAGTWSPVANTDVMKVTDQQGYLLFVRGSRANNLSQGINAISDNTVLRATGNLNVGTIVSSVDAAGYTLVGNPYAAPIDFGTVTRTNVPNNFYVWDPMLAGQSGVGGYVTVSYGAGVYTASASVSPITQYIQSGSAFFVKSTGSTGSITFHETDKVNQSSQTLQRPMGVTKQLRTNLLLVNADASQSLYDGVVVDYDATFSNGIDDYDAEKLGNGLANISILRDGKIFSIERRQPLDNGINDTVFFSLSKLAATNYSLQLNANNLNEPALQAKLVDSFLKTETIVDLNGSISVPFSVTADPASCAANRFMIVFKNTGTLATNFTAISATQQQKNIAINWQVDNEENVLRYEVEKSKNSQRFIVLGMIDAVVNNGKVNQYRLLDLDPGAGKYAYRVRQWSLSGKNVYSKVVKTEIINSRATIEVNPNSIIGNKIKLQMNQQPKGIYSIQLKSNNGQLLVTKQLNYTGGTGTEIINLQQRLSTGIYLLEIIGPDKIIQTIKLLKQ